MSYPPQLSNAAISNEIYLDDMPPVLSKEQVDSLVSMAENEHAEIIESIIQRISIELDRLPKFSVKNRRLSSKQRHHIHANRSREKKKRFQKELTLRLQTLSEEAIRIDEEHNQVYQLYCQKYLMRQQANLEQQSSSSFTTSASVISCFDNNPEESIQPHHDHLLPDPISQALHRSSECVETCEDPNYFGATNPEYPDCFNFHPPY